MTEFDVSTIILSFIITWTIGLLPPVLIRFAFLKRPITKWPAIGLCTILWLGNIVLFSAMGSQSKTHIVLFLIAFVSYNILRHRSLKTNSRKA